MIGVPTREKEIGGGGEISWECDADTCTSTFHTVNLIPRTCLHLFTCSPVPECVMYMPCKHTFFNLLISSLLEASFSLSEITCSCLAIRSVFTYKHISHSNYNRTNTRSEIHVHKYSKNKAIYQNY